MTDAPKAPGRRRRRIVVVTTAVFVLGLGWWFWPRMDQRIEGRWKCSIATEGPEFITFRPDGVATAEFGAGEVIHMEWRKEGSDLVFDLRGREKRSPVRFVGSDRLEMGILGEAGYTVLDRTER